MKLKSRFIISILVLILTIGLSLTAGGTRSSAAPMPIVGIDPSLTDAPAGVTVTGTLREGNTITYNVTIVNNGDTSTGVTPYTLSLALKTNMTFNSSISPDGTFGACTALGTPQTVTCTSAAALGPNPSTSHVNILVDLLAGLVGFPPQPVVVNFALSGGGDVNTANNSLSVSSAITGSPDVSIFKSNTELPFVVGNTDHYTIRVDNHGSATTTPGEVVVTDPKVGTLDPKLTYVSATGLNWLCGFSTGVITCTYNAAITSFGSSTDITVAVQPNPPGGGTATNNAKVTDSPEEPASFLANNASTDVIVPVKPAPDIALTNPLGTVPGPIFSVGATGQAFTFTVQNVAAAGGDTTAPVVVSGTLPANMTFDSATFNPGVTGFTCVAAGAPQVLTCTHNGVIAGGSAAIVVTVPVLVNAAVPSPASLTLTAQPTAGEANLSNNTGSVTVTINTVDIKLAKVAFNVPATLPVTFLPDPTFATDQGYTFTVTNVGTGPTIGNITLLDTLPTGITFQQIDPGGTAGWACSTVAGNGSLNCTYSGAALVALSGTATLNIKVRVAPSAPASVTNTGANVSTNGDPFPPGSGQSNVAPDVVTAINSADLTITKSHVDPFTATQNGTYSLVVKNVGTGKTVSNITVTDFLPTGFAFVSGTGTNWACVGPAPQIVCTFSAASLAPNATTTITMTVTPPNGGLAGSGGAPCTGTITPGFVNCAVVSSVDETVTNNDTAWDPTNVNAAPSPNLTISQAFAPNPLTSGGVGTLTYTVSNVGTSPTTAVATIQNNLPAGFTDYRHGVNGAGNGGVTWTCTGPFPTNAVNCTAPAPIANGNTSTIAIPISIAGTVTAGSYPNTAQVTTTGSPTGTNITNLIVQAAAVPDLSVTKAHTTGFIVNTPNNFIITVNNVGGAPTTAAQVTIVDSLPLNFAFNSGIDDPSDAAVNGSWGATCTPSGVPATGVTVTCNISFLGIAGGSHYKRLLINATSTVAGSYTNSAVIQATGGGGEANFANDSASDPVAVTATAKPDMTITMTNSGSFAVGATGSFVMTVSNIGSGPTLGSDTITVTNTLPASFTYISGSGSGWTCPAAAGQTSVACTYAAGSVGAGTVLNPLTIQVQPTLQGSFTFSAAVSPVTGESLATNNNVSNTVSVAGAFDLKVTKTHSPGNFIINPVPNSQTYTVTVQNIGSVPMPVGSSVTVTDPLDAALGPVTVTSTSFVCLPAGTIAAGSTVTCTDNTPIPNGGTVTFTIHVDAPDVNPSFPKNFTNVATATVTGATENNTSNNIGNDPTTITSGPQPDLALTKSHAASFVIGQQGTWTLTVRNVGSAAYSGPVTVTDTLPAGVSFVSGSAGCTNSSGTVTCTNGAASINVGASIIFTITVQVTAASPTTVNNTAAINPPVTNDANPANDTSTDATPIVTVPPISAANSSISAAPTTVLANGIQQSGITVLVKDTTGAAVQGATVTINASPSLGIGQPVVTPGPGGATTDATGTASFFMTSTAPGSVTLSATVNAVLITNGSPTVTFVSATGINLTNSNITVNPTTIAADGVSTSTVQVIVRDNLNNAVVGAGVTLSMTSNNGTPSAVFTLNSSTSSVTGTTDATGTASFVVRSSTKNETLTFSATVQPISGTLASLSQHPTLVIGNGSSSTSGLTGTLTTDFVSIPADNVAVATLTATLTQNSAAVVGKTITITSTGGPSGMTIQPSSAVTDSSGKVTFQVRSTGTGGPATFTATDSTDSFTFPTVQVSFTAIGTAAVPSSTATSTTTATSATATPGGPATGVVITRFLCTRAGPGFGFQRQKLTLPFRTIVTVLGRTARVIGLAVRDGCIHKGGPTWEFVQTSAGQQVWVNATYIRMSTLSFRGLPVLTPPAVTPATIAH